MPIGSSPATRARRGASGTAPLVEALIGRHKTALDDLAQAEALAQDKDEHRCRPAVGSLDRGLLPLRPRFAQKRT